VPARPPQPRHAAQAPGHPATVSVREDVLLDLVRQFFATHIFGTDRAALLARQLPAGAAEEAAQRDKQAARLRTRLKQIDTTEDAHVREVQALAGLDPNSAAVTAMRTRHLKRFTELETEREDIGRTLTALAKQATQTTGGNPALLDRLPMLGDLLGQAPDRIKQKLLDAFDIQALYSKPHNQVTL
jgi:site-specific DNA recombinase